MKEDLDSEVNSVQKISKYYGGRVKIVTVSDIENAVNSKNPDVLILHKVGPGNKQGKCMKFIISVSDGKPYYYNITDVTSKNPDAFLSDDFKKIQ